jgi:protein-tyrosine-phosphatase
MAEAILKRWGGQDFNPYSAGVEPSCEARPHAEEFLRAHRIWHPDLRCKNYREFLAPEAPSMDFIISLGEHPPVWMSTVWPGHPKIIHWHISEPILNGSEAEKTYSFNRTFAEFENRIRLLVLVYQKEATKRAATAA